MARTRRLVPWRQLCCAVLATLLVTALGATILRALVVPAAGVNGEHGDTGVLQLVLIPEEVAPLQSIRQTIRPTIKPKPADATKALNARAYLPAAQLSERPLLMQDIDPLLTGVQDGATQLLVLQLLINEYGDVDQVLVEDAAVPAELLWQLQQRFLRARFLPGRLKGRAVASALRIAVTLQAEP